jgi:hypothetical protein
VLDFLGCLAVQSVIAGIALFGPAYPVAWFGLRRGWTEKRIFWVYLPIMIPVVVLATEINGRICSLF